MRNLLFVYAKTKALSSAFVFAPFMYIVQSLYFIKSKFQASNHLLWLYSPVLDLVGNHEYRFYDHCQVPYGMKISQLFTVGHICL